MDQGKELMSTIRDEILGKIDLSREVADEEVLELIDREILKEARKSITSVEEMKQLRTEIFYSIRKLDVLQTLIDDNTVTEIMVNGPNDIFIERAGKLMQYPVAFSSKEKLEDVIQQIVARCNRVVNAASPIVDARLENGARVNVVLAPVALNGPILTIRRFPDKPISKKNLLAWGSMSAEIAGFLSKCVEAGCNIFISGGTGSGKTTFLNVLSDEIPSDERVITIEDNAELQIIHIPNLVKLEARNANMDGCKPISIRDLIKASLRMRPDRIIVGEIRGGEALDMLQAMNTGHSGSMSTGHANSAGDACARLETMTLMSSVELPVSAIRGQIAAGIDIIVHLGRLRDRSRKVLEIVEITGLEDGQIALSTLYKFEEEGEEDGKIIGSWVKKGELRDKSKFQLAGIRI